MNFPQQFRSAVDAVLNLFYPPHCAICMTDTAAREYLCCECRKEAPRIVPPCCHVCSEPYSGEIEAEFTCPKCADRSFHFDCAVASYRSAGPVRELIHQFKYNGKYHLRHVLGAWLADNLADARLQDPFACIVPVLLHPTRYRERGFNQAQVLAELLEKRSGVPVLNALKRIRYTSTQTRLSRDDRIQNLRNAFRMRKTVDVKQLHVLLIDDVLTTGSTVDECARVLMAAGAASVRVAAVARG